MKIENDPPPHLRLLVMAAIFVLGGAIFVSSGFRDSPASWLWR